MLPTPTLTLVKHGKLLHNLHALLGLALTIDFCLPRISLFLLCPDLLGPALLTVLHLLSAHVDPVLADHPMDLFAFMVLLSYIVFRIFLFSYYCLCAL